jgi:hypothetical protein
MLSDSQLYLQAPNNISTLMAAKTVEISSECSRQVTGPSSGYYSTLEPIKALHIVLQEALLMVKKSSLLNIQALVSPPFTREL